jgi:uncharacterized membrane protein (DUF373 family)
MTDIIKQSERLIIITLIFMMTFILLATTVNLGIVVVQKFLEAPNYLITVDGLMQVFDSFLIVLIGLELLETIRTYLKDNVVHVEVVMLVAIIAIARKVIILDYGKCTGIEIMGIGVLIISLALGYFFMKKALHNFSDNSQKIIKPKNEV